MNLSQVGFLFLTIIQIPSFYCAIHLFVQYAHRASPLRRLKNHLLLCLLIIATWTIIIELPGTQKYLWTGSVIIQTSWFCSLWNTSFWSTSALNRILMAFMCIQRHFLVFRPQTYRTHRSRLLFHYIPIIFIISIILIYQIVTNIFISCPGMYFNYSLFMCGYTCSVLIPDLATVYVWTFVFVPTVMTIISCVLLPIRFLIQKRQLQRVQWHRARKLIVQTTGIASVYTICWLPYTIMLQLVINNILSLSNPDVGRFFTIAPYMTSLLTPFIVFHTIRSQVNLGIMERIKHRFFPQRQGVVQPVNKFVLQQQNPSARDIHTSTRQLKIIKNT
jgi:hypothetical protein